MRGDVKNIATDDEAREKILAGMRKVSEVVAKTYGPTSGTVALQKPYGNPVFSKDGVSVASEVYLKDPDEDIGAGLVVNASKKANDISGDGTSATAILAYNIAKLAHKRIAAGYNPMKMKRGMEVAVNAVKKELLTHATEIDDKELHRVASISASDEAIGQLVADTVIKVGGVGINVENYEGLGIAQELVNGVYFEKGWAKPHFVTDIDNEETEYSAVSVLILEKRISSNGDIVPILEALFQQNPDPPKKLLIIGNVIGQALDVCVINHLSQKFPAELVVVQPPVYGDQVLPFLEDIATITGGKVLAENAPISEFSYQHLGGAEKILVTKDSTTILEGQGAQEDVDARIDTIKKQLKSDKYNAFQKERMELRLAKLQGKIGIIKVGGATEDEQKEAKFRVEDAINATRAAREAGIVPGGASTLVRIAQNIKLKLADDNEQAGAEVLLEALNEPFKQLLENAGEDAGYRLKQLQASDPGYGFDVTAMTDQPTDLMKAGVFDPLLVIQSVVENAASAAGVAITTHATVTRDRQYELEQAQINKARQ